MTTLSEIEPVARTRSGALRAHVGDHTLAWRGIPYAAAPTGAARWAAPGPAPVWTGIRSAEEFGARAPQVLTPELVPSGGATATDAHTELSEDCLFLNVCAPRTRTEGLPVLVWLHGGGYHWGSGATFHGDGEALARLGVVVVTVNYRLGALGFLRLDHRLGPAWRDSANLGLLDQLAALQWVHDNIAAFGGDPRRVTVGGVSAGGKSAVNVLASPLSTNLVHRAVVHSGGDHVTHPRAAARLADTLLDAVGVTEPTERLVRSIGVDELLAAQQGIATGVRATWLWRPMVDGRVLPMTPTAALRDGAAAGIPIIAGVTSHEAHGYDAAEPSTTEQVPRILEEVFGPRAAEVAAAYHAEDPRADERSVRRSVCADERYGIPTQRILDAQSQHADVWSYVFSAPSPTGDDRLRGCHGADMPYLWDAGLEAAPTAIHTLARAQREAWAAFIVTGKPHSDALPYWPTHTPAERSTLCLDVPSTVQHDPRSAIRNLWTTAEWTPGPWWALEQD
jgi:para-nitrobenzyl esterase